MYRLLLVPVLFTLLSVGGIGCGKKDLRGGSEKTAGESGQTPAGWVKVSMPEGRCEVWMPVQPKREVQDNEDGMKNYLYMYDADVRGYLASVTNVPNEKQLAVIKARGDTAYHLEAARDRVVNNEPGCKLLADKESQYNGHPGREFQYKSPDGSMTSIRHYMIGWQLYSLGTWAPTQEEVTSKDAALFFNSFKVLDAGSKDK